MSVYYKFNDGDILDYSINTSPKNTFASGVDGWRGSTGVSGSISLYGGIRSRSVSNINIRPSYTIDTYTIDGKLNISGSYPLTSSINFVNVRNTEFANRATQLTKENWGKEHFSAILNLYDYYNKLNVDYTTASYDYYCLFSSHYDNGNTNSVKYLYASGSSKFDMLSASYTVEAMVKPFSITGSDQYTIFGRHNLWRFYIDGPTGKLAFSASDGKNVLYTSSYGPTANVWSHVCWRVGNGTGSFTINLVDAGNILTTGSLKVGTSANVEHFYVCSTGSNPLYGLIYETKLWSTKRTFEQLSSSFNSTLISSSSADLIHYSRFNDGPLSDNHGKSAGSGAFDYSNSPIHGELLNFNNTGRTSVVWLPNDNESFTTTKNLISKNVNFFKVLNIPSLFYGRQIATGSVNIVCNSFLSSSMIRTIVDDGRGGLYVSGSYCSGTFESRIQSPGVKWNKIGNVFYSEGLIVIKDPSLANFAETNEASSMARDLLQLSFNGVTKTPSKVFMCRVGSAQANASKNSSFSRLNANTGNKDIVREENDTYITSVGIYNKERKLVAIAKLANPLRKRPKDRINIKLKIDF